MIKVIKLGTEWCGPCRTMSPTIKRLQEKYNTEGSDITVESIDVDHNPDAAIKYGVKNIPTTLFIKDDVVQFREVGVLAVWKIEELITKLK
jgi:thioredoxin 1